MNKLESILAALENSTFDPEGEDYDYATARAAGFSADATGHWPSREPMTGLILKGANHPTFHKTRSSDAELGYDIRRGSSGRYYSKKHEDFLRSSPDDNDSHWSDFEAHMPWDKNMHPMARYGERVSGPAIHFPLPMAQHIGPYGTETRMGTRLGSTRGGVRRERLGQYGPLGMDTEYAEKEQQMMDGFGLEPGQPLPLGKAIVLGTGYRDIDFIGDDEALMASVPNETYEHELMHAAMDDPKIRDKVQEILATIGGRDPEHDIVDAAFGRVKNDHVKNALEQILQLMK